jgi:hypothetical protein
MLAKYTAGAAGTAAHASTEHAQLPLPPLLAALLTPPVPLVLAYGAPPEGA